MHVHLLHCTCTCTALHPGSCPPSPPREPVHRLRVHSRLEHCIFPDPHLSLPSASSSGNGNASARGGRKALLLPASALYTLCSLGHPAVLCILHPAHCALSCHAMPCRTHLQYIHLQRTHIDRVFQDALILSFPTLAESSCNRYSQSRRLILLCLTACPAGRPSNHPSTRTPTHPPTHVRVLAGSHSQPGPPRGVLIFTATARVRELLHRSPVFSPTCLSTTSCATSTATVA